MSAIDPNEQLFDNDDNPSTVADVDTSFASVDMNNGPSAPPPMGSTPLTSDDDGDGGSGGTLVITVSGFVACRCLRSACRFDDARLARIVQRVPRIDTMQMLVTSHSFCRVLLHDHF
jgi:hypothetical protein